MCAGVVGLSEIVDLCCAAEGKQTTRGAGAKKTLCRTAKRGGNKRAGEGSAGGGVQRVRAGGPGHVRKFRE